jgi:cupin 2 domain-containing protein
MPGSSFGLCNPDVPVNPNLFSNNPANLPEELTTVLQEGHGVRIERIVSRGHSSPAGFWYDQPESEWVLVLKGAARLEFEDRMVEMGPGDYTNIPAHTKHRVEWTTPDEPTVWLAVHYGEATPAVRTTSN